jgi:hypothetical protein
MHPRRLQRGALSIALAGTLLVAGSASAKKLRFQGWTPLSDYVAAGLSEGGSFRLTVPTRAGETEVALHPVDVNAAGYHAEEAVQSGERRGRRRPMLRTFAGSIEKAGTHRVRHGKGGDFARLSREAGGRVSGLMRVDGVLYDLAADPAAGDLVLQVNEVDPDELAKVLAACGMAVDEALAGESVAADANATPSDGSGLPESAAAGVLHEVELGTEADAPFVAQTGSVDAANARIASIVNAINGIYEFDLDLTLKVVFQRAWNGSDPYTSTNSDALLTQLFTGIVGTLGATFVWDIAHTDSVSPDLEVPKWIVYLCIPLGSYLMCFRFLQVAVHFAKTGDLPHHDVAHVEGIETPDLNQPGHVPESNRGRAGPNDGGRSL